MKRQTTLAQRLRNVLATFGLGLALLTWATYTLADGKEHGPQFDDKLGRIGHIIVIYQENWSFDSLYGQFPGADGLQNGFDTLTQKDKSTNYTTLLYTTPSPLNGGVDPQFPAAGGNLALSATQPFPLPLIPYDFTNYIPATAKTGDIVHRFYHQQLQIDNGVLEPKRGDLGQVCHLERQPRPGVELSRRDLAAGGQASAGIRALRPVLPLGVRWLIPESPMADCGADASMDGSHSGGLGVELRSRGEEAQ